MANAVEEALNRANADQRAHAYSVIEQARRDIQTAEIQSSVERTNDMAAIISRNEQIIEEAKRSIPAETMQSVDHISSPMTTPPMHGYVNSTPIELHPDIHSDITSIEQSGG